MSEISCKKCGGKQFYTSKKGNNTGLYCASCHNWIKWLGKKDLELFNSTGKAFEKPETARNNTSSAGVKLQTNIASYIAHLQTVLSELNEVEAYSDIERERLEEKCKTYAGVIKALENIRDNKQWYDK